MPVKIYAEIPFLLLFFAFILSASIKGNLIIYRTCYAILGYNKSECVLLGSQNPDNFTHELEKIVEPHASVISMSISVIEGLLSAVICLFVGPWSDKYGRKPVLLIPPIGFVVYFLLYALLSFFDNASPWYFLLCSIPMCLTGGTSSYLTVFLCYITEVSSEKNRGIRMGVFEAIITLGIMLGHLSSSYILYATSYQVVFFIAATCCILNVILTIFCVPESLTNPETEGKFRNFFQFSHVLEMVRTTFKKRENYNRFIFLICLLMTTIGIIIANGDGAVQSLFLRGKFQWSLRDYTTYSAITSLNWVLGAIIGIYLLHTLIKIPETLMIVIGFISASVGSLILGFAQYRWEIYAAAFSRALGGVINPMARSLISKIIPFEEIGKIFSLILVFESLIGLIGSPIYTGIYNATIQSDPAVYNFFSAGLYVIGVGLAISMIVIPTRIRYEEFSNENDNTTET